MNDDSSVDVAVVGAGLAGLACAVQLARGGARVALYEEGQLPRHRVCGEYVSREVLPFLETLGLDVFTLGAKRLDRFELSTPKGRAFRSMLDLGGFGLSRYRFDGALLELAREANVHVELGQAVRHVEFDADRFVVHVRSARIQARLVLGSFGKRSRLDQGLRRPHARRRSKYVAVKRHYRGDFPPDLVGLHFIPGGYCGISAVEGDRVNVCYLTDAAAIRQGGGVDGFDRAGLTSNPLLATYLQRLEPTFERPLVISQVDFAPKHAVHEHILMLGDAAGLIHPLVGNGMAMALRAAAMVVPRAFAFLSGRLTRDALETAHRRQLVTEFGPRRQLSRGLHRLFESSPAGEAVCAAANLLPGLARFVIRSTHGTTF